jgi:hypothetical protein
MVAADELGCAILGPKRAYEGILLTGFEASNFRSSDFEQVEGMESDDTRAWFNCPPGGCGDLLETQLDQRVLGECESVHFHSGTGIASVKVIGWVTQSPGNYGHLGQYPREFYALEIIDVSPPPTGFVREFISGLRQLDAC